MPVPFPTLIPCGSCGCHARASESACPHCGAAMRTADGAVPRTKVALLMGLTAALFQPLACTSDVVESPNQGSSSSSSGGGIGGGDINFGSAYGGGPSFGGNGNISTGPSSVGGGGSVGGDDLGGGGMGGSDISVGGAYGSGPSFGEGEPEGFGGAGGSGE